MQADTKQGVGRSNCRDVSWHPGNPEEVTANSSGGNDVEFCQKSRSVLNGNEQSDYSR